MSAGEREEKTFRDTGQLEIERALTLLRMTASYNDPASQSKPTQAAATHASMVLAVDFEARVIRGFVEYDVEIKVTG